MSENSFNERQAEKLWKCWATQKKQEHMYCVHENWKMCILNKKKQIGKISKIKSPEKISTDDLLAEIKIDFITCAPKLTNTWNNKTTTKKIKLIFFIKFYLERVGWNRARTIWTEFAKKEIFWTIELKLFERRAATATACAVRTHTTTLSWYMSFYL